MWGCYLDKQGTYSGVNDNLLEKQGTYSDVTDINPQYKRIFTLKNTWNTIIETISSVGSGSIEDVEMFWMIRFWVSDSNDI